MTTYGPTEWLALAVAISFAAGLNVYAVTATLGLLAQFGIVTLPAPIAIVANWWVIGVSIALFAIEFFADKIPMVDLVWNALQTLVRVPAGALLAFGATSSLPPSLQIAAAAGGGAIALASAGGKLALRGAVTASPEPVTNIALSVAEDVLAIGLTWFATEHPWLAASIALTLLAGSILVMGAIVRALRAVFRGAGRQLMGSHAGSRG